MNWPIILSGILAAITALVHILVGGKQIAGPLLHSQLDSIVKLTMYACWHLVSVSLVLSSATLLACGIGLFTSRELVAFVSISWILFGLVFLFVTLAVAKPTGFFRLPQWTLLIPVGLLGLWGIA
jgi:hypothetical protein